MTSKFQAAEWLIMAYERGHASGRFGNPRARGKTLGANIIGRTFSDDDAEALRHAFELGYRVGAESAAAEEAERGIE